jgi:hypothetical protein
MRFFCANFVARLPVIFVFMEEMIGRGIVGLRPLTADEVKLLMQIGLGSPDLRGNTQLAV